MLNPPYNCYAKTTLCKIIRTALDKAGFTEITPHNAGRHGHASQLWKRGASAPEVQYRMGHSDIRTTMIYSHIDPEDQERYARGKSVSERSLFSGAGGGLLATKHLLGFKTIGYVEIEPYCQAILAQRIDDGHLDPAPIFRDIRQFISKGYAEAYKGMVDVITTGPPCQPFSVGGLQLGSRDERNMLYHTKDKIREWLEQHGKR